MNPDSPVTQGAPAASVGAEPAYHYNQPFLQPAPVWDYWFLLLFPLLLVICLVYKTVKVSHIRELPRQAGEMFGWLIAGLAASAVGLWLFVKITG